MSKETLQVIEHVALVTSEVLPFIPFIASNGIIQGVLKGIVACLNFLINDGDDE